MQWMHVYDNHSRFQKAFWKSHSDISKSKGNQNTKQNKNKKSITETFMVSIPSESHSNLLK